MEPLEAIADALQGSDLLGREGPWLQRRQTQLADPLGRVTHREQVRRLGVDPGGEARERGQVVVDRGGRQSLVGEGVLPGQDVALEDVPDPLVAVRFLIEGAEALEMERDLVGNLFGSDPDDGQGQVAGDLG